MFSGNSGKAARYEPRAGFRTYLYGIAVKMVSAERRKAGRELQQTDGLDGAAGDASSDAGLWVRQALEQLDKADREILMLREYEQLSYAEIAARLQVPVNTVRSRIFRARMALKEKLMPVQGDVEGLP